jgi:hypothetical protein
VATCCVQVGENFVVGYPQPLIFIRPPSLSFIFFLAYIRYFNGFIDNSDFEFLHLLKNQIYPGRCVLALEVRFWCEGNRTSDAKTRKLRPGYPHLHFIYWITWFIFHLFYIRCFNVLIEHNFFKFLQADKHNSISADPSWRWECDLGVRVTALPTPRRGNFGGMATGCVQVVASVVFFGASGFLSIGLPLIFG